MPDWLMNLIVIGILVLIVAFAVRSIWKDHKAGNHCSGDCCHCSGCHASSRLPKAGGKPPKKN